MAQKTLSASASIKGGETKKVYHIVLSGTGNSSAVFKYGGASGTANGPTVLAIANDTTECSFPGGIVCDYVTLAGTGVSCWISFS